MSLTSITRPADGEPDGLIVLLHGRGADEHDLYPLLDMLDPHRRLIGVCPRGPLALPPGGAHWYRVLQVGYPDPTTFRPTFDRLTRWFDALVDELDLMPDRVVVGGFSQGCVMSYALALGAGRPPPAGLIGLSGFMPTLEGFELDLAEVKDWPVAIGHGIYDPVIGVQWGRDARRRLEEAGAHVLYHESPIDHTIDPDFLSVIRSWVERVVPAR
ncbi:MAG: phospholipase [Actinomycetota bacterium]|nr:phospholipase [Actinomycetota bacterium]